MLAMQLYFLLALPLKITDQVSIIIMYQLYYKEIIKKLSKLLVMVSYIQPVYPNMNFVGGKLFNCFAI